MKVTPFSQETYYPYLLSNGMDAALVTYNGGMYSGGHNVGHQGVPCGWYKISHRKPLESIMPILQTGYSLTFNGLVTCPMHYEQEFDPKRAILTTCTKIYGGLEFKVSSFMAAAHLMVEHFELISLPGNGKIGLILSVQHPDFFFDFHTRYNPKLQFNAFGENSVNIKYQVEQQEILGAGFMRADRHGIPEMGERSSGLRFENLSVGWSVTKFLSVIDNKDCRGYDDMLERNLSRCELGYEQIRKEHEQDWLEYSNNSTVNIPDEKLQYLYDLGVYSCRAHLHPDTGGINCGMITNLWGGGVCCPDDANYTHVGLLRTNSQESANHHLDYYRRFHEEGKKFAVAHNMPGITMPVWGNCFGEHVSTDYGWYIFQAKMSQLGCVVHAIYWFWKYYPEHSANRDNLRLMEELLDFIYAGAIADNGVEAYVRDCKAGDEGPRNVKNDTYATSVFSVAFSGFEEMSEALGVPLKNAFSGLGKRLLSALSKNFKDGFLYPYQDAEHPTFAPIHYIYHLPNEFPPAECVRNLNSRTPWGIAGGVTSSYRDWPWFGSRLAIALAHIGDSKDAFFWLKDSCKYAAATGALPEKIRIDGYPVNYWYSSTHALLVWAMTFAMCHRGKDGSLRLLYGLDGEWEDLEFKKLRVCDGLEVSAKVQNKTVATLRIINRAPWTQSVTIKVNPVYKYAGPLTVTLKQNENFDFVNTIERRIVDE